MKDGRILTLMVTTAVHYAGVKMVCPGLIGKASDNTLNTAPSAAYPPGMCMKLAGALIQSWLDKMRKDECAPRVGDSEGWHSGAGRSSSFYFGRAGRAASRHTRGQWWQRGANSSSSNSSSNQFAFSSVSG